MDRASLVATLAGICTTISFVPQVIKIYRTRHTKDLSLPMYALFLSGVILWMCYGILILSWPVILANGFTVALASYILAMKIKYK